MGGCSEHDVLTASASSDDGYRILEPGSWIIALMLCASVFSNYLCMGGQCGITIIVITLSTIPPSHLSSRSEGKKRDLQAAEALRVLCSFVMYVYVLCKKAQRRFISDSSQDPQAFLVYISIGASCSTHVSESVIRISPLHCVKHIVHCLNSPSLGYRPAILQRCKDQPCIGNAGNRGQHSSELETHQHLR
jgi:hypothetical protein